MNLDNLVFSRNLSKVWLFQINSTVWPLFDSIVWFVKFLIIVFDENQTRFKIGIMVDYSFKFFEKEIFFDYS